MSGGAERGGAKRSDEYTAQRGGGYAPQHDSGYAPRHDDPNATQSTARRPQPPALDGAPDWKPPHSNRGRSPYTAQSRLLRRKIMTRTCLTAVTFIAAYFVLMWSFNTTLAPRIGEYVADTTAPWSYFSADDYERYMANPDVQANSANLDINVNWAHLYPSTSSDEPTTSDQVDETYPDDLGDWDYAVRDLTTYNALKACKLPLAIGIGLTGLLIILLGALNRSLRYFNELSSSITDLFANRESPITLPDDLSIIRNELVDIREASLADKRAAANAERRKNELVAYLAHDIKTPLTSVMGYLSLLAEAPDLPQKTRAAYAGIALDKAERLEGLVDEFFEITRYNLQSIPIERHMIDLALLCRQVADEFYPEAQARSLTLEIDTPEEVMAFADPDKIARVLSNVMRNALTYADRDTTVHLHAACENDVVVIRISDQGQEISPTHLESIFEKFFREDASRSSAQGGTGLGLAIAREIAVAHGGSIHASSEQGLTTFTLTLPCDAHATRG